MAWGGRRYKTSEYKQYEKILFYLLPNDFKIPEGDLALKLTFGFSSSASDLDNPVKPFVDMLQKKYNFNDKRIYHLEVSKKIVPKGKEFIDFEFHSIK